MTRTWQRSAPPSVLILAMVLLLTTSLPTSAVAQDSGSPAAPVRVGIVTQRALPSSTVAPGDVVSLNEGRIAAETAGRLLWVAAPGERVAEGAPLARLDTAQLELERRQNEATIARLAAGLKYQEQQVGRFRELTRQHIAARNQLDEAIAQSEMTRQELEQAKIAREQTMHLLARAVVVAPFGGQVVERLRQAGEYVAVGSELVRLVDTTHVEARIQAPIKVASYLSQGDQVVIADRDERRFAVPVRAIIPVADARSRLMEIRVALPAAAWPIGAAVRAELPDGPPQTVTAVPRDALILRRDTAFVYRLGPDGTVERITVERGNGDAEYVAVQGELSPGDRVVIRGGETLQPGQRVAISPDTTSQAHVATEPERDSRG
jgi:RND family efflux transporter MFP subunit